MKMFRINDKISIECEWKKTRTGFKHVATLYVNGWIEDETKICYLNRTWESYEFQSVMERLIEKTRALTKAEKTLTSKFVKNYKEKGHFKGLQTAIALGNVICDTKEDRNNWKKRMMKASLGEAITFPENWDSLAEDEKERRLNEVLVALK